MRGWALLAGLGVVSFLTGCGGYTAPNSPTNGGSNTVTVGNNLFSPASLNVPVNTTVTWSWASGAADHNVTFDGGPASPTQSAGTYQRTFGAAGTYTYHCTIHVGVGMQGTITVTGAGAGGPGGGSGGGGMGGGGYGT
jgi:plastocyanin